MRKLAAIMFTDLVGYSALSQKNEALALELLEEHRGLLRPLFTQHNGKEIKTIGDAFLVEFASAVEAAQCAIDIQKALTAHTSVVAPERHIQVRIGLHVGDVVIEEGDVLGDGVNIASRIEPLAKPGGICLTESIAEQVRNKIDQPLELLGEKEIKGIKKPVTVYRLVLPWEKEAGFLRRVRVALRKPLRARLVQAGMIALLIAAGVIWWRTSQRIPSIRPGQITRLAVLPFTNLMNDPEQEYFVDGFHDALLTELSKLGALTVISRQSVLAYKGSDKSLGDIARELGVHALIEGSILRAGDQVRFNVQLIEGATDDHLWADMFDRKLVDVLSLHSDVARAIADQVKITLTPGEESLLAGARQVNPETYELYLKGMFHLHKSTPEGYKTSLEYLNRAIEIDPTEPLAYAGLALVYSLIGHDFDPNAFAKSRAAAEKALELDSTLAEVHESFAEIKMYYEWDIPGAEMTFEKVIALNPNLAIAHGQYSWLLMALKRYDEASAEIERAVELDPLNPLYPAWAGWQNMWIGRFEGVLEWAHKSLELNPDFPWGLYVLGRIHGLEGRFAEAIEAHARAAEVAPFLKWALGYSYALSGQADKALAIARELAVQPAPMDNWGLAMIYTALGDKDEAFRWLDGAVAARWAWMPWLEIPIAFRPLHSDPRFSALVEKIGAAD